MRVKSRVTPKWVAPGGLILTHTHMVCFNLRKSSNISQRNGLYKTTLDPLKQDGLMQGWLLLKGKSVPRGKGSTEDYMQSGS